VNLSLVALFIIICFLFSIIAVYAQTHIAEINEEFDEKVVEIDNITEQLREETLRAGEMAQAQRVREVLERNIKDLQDENDVLLEDIES